MYYSFQSSKNLYLVMEYMPGGDLHALLKNLESFEENMTRFYLSEVCVCVCFVAFFLSFAFLLSISAICVLSLHFFTYYSYTLAFSIFIYRRGMCVFCCGFTYYSYTFAYSMFISQRGMCVLSLRFLLLFLYLFFSIFKHCSCFSSSSCPVFILHNNTG